MQGSRTIGVPCIVVLSLCSWVGVAVGAMFQYPGGADAVLKYSPSASNVPTAISFSITASNLIPAGSQVELQLPGFTRNAGGSLALQQTTGLGPAATGMWNEVAQTLLLQVPSQVGTIAGTIPVSEGMRLPRSGLLKDQTDLRYSRTQSFVSPAVGSFGQGTRLEYTGTVISGHLIDLRISFRNHMNILSGEVVMLTLPNFNGDSFSLANNVVAKNMDDKGRFVASWDSAAFTLLLHYLCDTGGCELESDFQENIEVKGKLRVPSDGVALNDPTLTIETTAIQGPVSAIPIDFSDSVKGVIRSSSLSFCEGQCTFNMFEWLCVTKRAHPAQSTEMTFSFVFEVDLVENETVVLFLPGFAGPDRTKIPISGHPLCKVGVNPPPYEFTVALKQHPYGCTSNALCEALAYTGSGVLGRASWSNTSKELTLTAVMAVSEGTQHVVAVPMNSGISLPAAGIRTNSMDIKLRSECVSGPIPPASPRSVLSVGALQNVVLSFTPALPAVTTEIAFSFTASMDLEVGDVLQLMLLDLNDDTVSGDPVASSSPDAFKSGVTWNKALNTLFLTCTQKLIAATSIAVRVPASFGLRLPLEGVGPTSDHHFYVLNATHGYIPNTRVVQTTDVPPVLDATILTYGASSGFNFSTLTFQFTAKRALAVGDKITLRLEGFTGKSTEASGGSLSSLVTSKVQQSDSTFQGGSYIERYEWRPGVDSTLQAVLSAIVAMDATIQITFAQNVKIALPVFGIVANSLLLRVECTFANGQTMSAIPIKTSPFVSPVLDSASLEFGPVRAGARANLTLTLVPGFEQGFQRRDTIALHLPGFNFTSSSFTVSSALKSNVYFNEARWANDVLTFTVSTPFTTQVSVTLTSHAGIKVPAAGVRAPNKHLSIQGSVQALGSFFFSAIPHVQSVGALQQGDALSPKLVFGGTNPGANTQPVANLSTAIDFTFGSQMVLHAGDTVTLTLTDFHGILRRDVDVTSTPLNAFRRASWDPSSDLLVFTVGSITPIAALTRIQVLLPTNIARLPQLGLVSCSGRLDSAFCPISVSVLAIEGDVLTTPKTWIYNYQTVGMLPSSSFRCVPSTPAVLSRIEVGFSSIQMLRPGDTVFIQLAAFKLKDPETNTYVSNPVVSFPVTGINIFDIGSISKRGEDLLVTLVATREASAGLKQLVIIPSSAGIEIPRRGIPYEDATRLELYIEAQEGSVSKVLINEITNIGAFLGAPTTSMAASFNLDPPSAGYVSEFSIFFTPTMSVKPGEYFTFFLPGFTGPDEAVSFVVIQKFIKANSQEEWVSAPYINQIRWTFDSASFNATIIETIPANTILKLIVGRDAKIAIPGSGIPDTARFTTMFVSVFAQNGAIYRQPIEFLSIIQSVLSMRNFEVLPKRAGTPSQIILTLQARLKLNAGTTILFYMPGFSGGRHCWNALPGDSGMKLRCLTHQRSNVCGGERTPPCSRDVHRYCLPFSPSLNAFDAKPVGGCTFEPKLYLGAHSSPVASKEVGLCACLEGDEYQEMLLRIQGYWNSTGAGIDGLQIPANYGSTCWPWDSQTLFRSSVDCSKLLRGQQGPHCCSSFCFVQDNCPTAVPWQGYNSSWDGLMGYVSYDTCDDDKQVVEECPYKFPNEGRGGLLTGSWTEYDSYLVLTLTSPIVAFLPMTVTVPIEANISTPMVGLGESFTRLDVDLLDVEANTRMSPLRAVVVDAIGTFLDATLSIDEFSAGMAVPITIRFTPRMPIQAGENVEFLLSDFESDSASIRLTSDPPRFAMSNWNAATETLTSFASADITADQIITIYIPRTLRLPVTGLSAASVMWILTNAESGSVLRSSPFPIRALQNVGSLWNTAVSFNPPVFDETMNVTLEFRSRMPLVSGDTVELTMEGFTGPPTARGDPMYVAALFSEPAQMFSVAWHNDGASAPKLVVVINNEIRLPVDTHFRTTIPSNCTFKNVAQQCTNQVGISRPSSAAEYDPKGLYLTGRDCQNTAHF